MPRSSMRQKPPARRMIVVEAGILAAIVISASLYAYTSRPPFDAPVIRESKKSFDGMIRTDGNGASAGTISGSLSFAGNPPPPLTVCAEDVVSRIATCVLYRPDADPMPEYSLEVVPGTYRVYMYETGKPEEKRFYTAHSACGGQEMCTDHSVLPVIVTKFGVTGDIQPSDRDYRIGK